MDSRILLCCYKSPPQTDLVDADAAESVTNQLITTDCMTFWPRRPSSTARFLVA